MSPGGVLERDVMRNLRAAHTKLCHDANISASHWECWVAAARKIIALFYVCT